MALGAMSGCGSIPAASAAVRTDGTAFTPKLGATPTGAATGPTSRYQTPYLLSADCSLSEDYFQLKLGSLDPANDRIIGYPQNNAYVSEAIVLHGGALSQLYHDWTNHNAWNIAALPNSEGALDVVAGAPLDQDNNLRGLHVFFRTAGGSVTHLRQNDDSSWTDLQDVEWPNAGPLQQSQDPDGGLFVYSVSTVDKTLYWYSAYWDGSAGAKSRSGKITNITSKDVAARMSKAGPQPDDAAFDPNFYVVVYEVSTTLVGQVFVWSAQVAGSGTGQTVAAELVSWLPSYAGAPPHSNATRVEYLFAMNEWMMPMAVVRAVDNGLWSLSANGGQWAWQPLCSGPASSSTPVVVVPGVRGLSAPEDDTAWSRSDKVLDLYVQSGSTMSVIHQVATGDSAQDSSAPTFTPSVPLQPGVGQIAVPGSRGTGTGLVLLGTDGNLQSLILQSQEDASASGDLVWVGSDIHLPASELAQVTSYRVQLSVVDSGGLPIGGQPLNVSCANTVTVLVNGQALPLNASTPLNLTSDRFGRATFAVPADGMSTPSLTVTSDGIETLVVRPNEAVHSYLAGTGSLNGLATFNGATLTSASVTDPLTNTSTTVAPKLTHDQTGLAGTAADAMKNTALAALNSVQQVQGRPVRSVTAGAQIAKTRRTCQRMSGRRSPISSTTACTRSRLPPRRFSGSSSTLPKDWSASSPTSRRWRVRPSRSW